MIVGTDRLAIFSGRAGDGVVCAEGGNDRLDSGDVDLLIGDRTNAAPFVPTSGPNDDRLFGGWGNDTLGNGSSDDITRGRGGDLDADDRFPPRIERSFRPGIHNEGDGGASCPDQVLRCEATIQLVSR